MRQSTCETTKKGNCWTNCALPFKGLIWAGNRRLFTAFLFFNARVRKKRAKRAGSKEGGGKGGGRVGLEGSETSRPVKSPVLSIRGFGDRMKIRENGRRRSTVSGLARLLARILLFVYMGNFCAVDRDKIQGRKLKWGNINLYLSRL